MELSRFTESLRTILTSLLVLLAAVPLSASSLQSPTEVIRWSNQEILAIYESNDEIDQEALDLVHEIMDQVTSFESLAGDAIDVFCDRFEESQCQAFKDAFVELLSVSSVRRLGRYRADRFEYLAESIEDDTALVQTLAYYEDDGVEIDYRLGLIDGQWLIVNYFVDGVDTVMNWRRQFRRLLRSDSVEDVILRLERKTEEYEREARSRGDRRR
jgi:phospholipid transport system substrate-binding protein